MWVYRDGIYYEKQMKKYNILGIFTTKFTSEKVLQRILQAYEIKKLITAYQTHSKIIKFVNKDDVYSEPQKSTVVNPWFGVYYKCDGFITNKENIGLCIRVADCVPLFFHDVDRNIVGIVHAGWRGIVKGIIEKCIDCIKRLNLEKNKILFYIGPHICKKCYEFRNKEIGKKFIYGYRNGYLSLKDEIKMRLLIKGLPEENIKSSKFCTYHNNDEFFSYRRGDKEKRIFTIISKLKK